MKNLYDYKVESLDGKEINFADFKGKKVLIVNTASECGFTPQFKELEELHQKYGNNLIVIGFPSNDFGAQDPGSNSDIKQFCELNYGVTFLMMEKSSVKGKEKNDVYKWLSEKDKNGWNTSEPGWNFCKYLIDEKGRLTAFFPSKVKPMSTEITSKL